jgi:hypothetical protein
MVALLGLILAATPVGSFTNEPLNPFARSRTPLAALAFPGGDGPTVSAAFDWGNSVEASWLNDRVRLDAEYWLWRAELWAPLGSTRLWLYARLAAGTVGPGALDRLIDGWHDVLFGGARVFPQRLYGPIDGYADQVDLPLAQRRVEAGPFFSETKLGWAVRPVPWAFVALTLSIPTTTREGRGLSAPGLGAWARARWSPWRWLALEAAAGLGASARAGPLAPYQAVLFAATALEAAVAPHSDHALFVQGWLHSPYYAHTGHFALDDPDLSVKLGYRVRVAGRLECELAATEDLSNGSALDLELHLSLRLTTE